MTVQKQATWRTGDVGAWLVRAPGAKFTLDALHHALAHTLPR
ncbi:hypothetical protein [Streptomyces sp. NPDC005953]